MSRFARQIILREVGPGGQAAIERSSLGLSQDLHPFVAEIAIAYGEGAGLQSAPPNAERTEVPDWFPPLVHEAPAQVAAGALLALKAIREALSTVDPAHPTRVQGEP